MKYLLSVIAILWGINVYAQLSPAPQGLDNYKCIDTTRFEIHYSFKFKNHSSQKQYNEDRRVIQVGRSVIKDYSEIIYHYDSLATENFKKGFGNNSVKGCRTLHRMKHYEISIICHSYSLGY